jgi:hypothetical protein
MSNSGSFSHSDRFSGAKNRQKAFCHPENYAFYISLLLCIECIMQKSRHAPALFARMIAS